MSEDIIFYEDADRKWYFWDEAWFRHGPFDSRQETEAALDDYVKWLEGGE